MSRGKTDRPAFPQRSYLIPSPRPKVKKYPNRNGRTEGGKNEAGEPPRRIAAKSAPPRGHSVQGDEAPQSFLREREDEDLEEDEDREDELEDREELLELREGEL